MSQPNPNAGTGASGDPNAELRPANARWRRWRPWVIGFVVGAVYVTALRPFLRHVPDPPPVLGSAPEFVLTDQLGQPFRSEKMRGSVWIVNFFFTSCPSICPTLMANVKRLDDRFAKANVPARIASITVDPQTDTVERLAEYGQRVGIDPARWSLLTGPEETIERVVTQGFLTARSERQPLEGGLYEITHSAKLILVDSQGHVRGYYDSDDMGLDEVFHRAQHVMREKGSSPPR